MNKFFTLFVHKHIQEVDITTYTQWHCRGTGQMMYNQINKTQLIYDVWKKYKFSNHQKRVGGWGRLNFVKIYLILYIFHAVFCNNFLLFQLLHIISSRVFLLHVSAVTSSHLQAVNIKWFTQQQSIINGTSYLHPYIVIITNMRFKFQYNKIEEWIK
jgi:hypothetical protein